MIAKKEIIVLNGGGHKGIVKISGVAGKDNMAKINCSLDFRPFGAKLYLIGDNIAQIELKDTNCNVEVPFNAKGEVGCVLRSSSITMFGGSGAKSEMLKKIEAFNKEHARQTTKKSEEQPVVGAQTHTDCNAQNCDTANEENTDDMISDTEGKASGQESAHMPNEEGKEKRKPYVGVASKSDVNPLGEWTKYDGNNFYYAVKPQIDEMFICYPTEELLCSTVPNSKWVRVDDEDGYYVVGLLFDDDEPSYICYGVPEYQKNAKVPSELENMCVWLPLNSEELVGYWMIYQSAKTGEIIR